MKNTTRIIGWICFVIAAVVYLIATCYFGIGFASTIAENNSGEVLGRVTLFLVFMVIGSIIYAFDVIISIMGALVANVKRGEKKFFFWPVITLILSVLTWIIFLLFCII